MAIKSKIRPNRQTENTPHQKMSPMSENTLRSWFIQETIHCVVSSTKICEDAISNRGVAAIPDCYSLPSDVLLFLIQSKCNHTTLISIKALRFVWRDLHRFPQNLIFSSEGSLSSTKETFLTKKTQTLTTEPIRIYEASMEWKSSGADRQMRWR